MYINAEQDSDDEFLPMPPMPNIIELDNNIDNIEIDDGMLLIFLPNYISNRLIRFILQMKFLQRRGQKVSFGKKF